MRHFRKTLFILLAFGVWPLVQAYVLDDLFHARFEVQTETVQEREARLRDGLLQVLKRSSGQANIVEHPLVQEAISAPDQYVHEYAYEVRDVATYEKSLGVEFDEARIEQLLESVGLPLWGENRPMTLIWMVHEENNDKALIGAEQEDIVHAVDAIAKDWGLPIIFPLMDLTDMMSVSITDIWGQFTDVIEQASLRYATDAVVVIRAHHDIDKGWMAQWELLLPSGSKHFQVADLDYQTMIDKGFAKLAQHLSHTYTAHARHKKRARQEDIWVDGVDDYQTYQAIRRYLSGLDVIRDVQLRALKDGKATLSLEILGGDAALERSLKLDQLLLPREKNHYQWIPAARL